MSHSAIGMMDDAYFVGRKVILDWLNETLKLNLQKIEETASGAVACQLLDALFPGKVPMSKVNWGAKNAYDFVANYKILQTVFKEVSLDKNIPVEKLVQARYQDNLEWMQFLKAYFDLNAPEGIKEYDAIGRRGKGKGVKLYKPAANDGTTPSMDGTISTKPVVSSPPALSKPTVSPSAKPTSAEKKKNLALHSAAKSITTTAKQSVISKPVPNTGKISTTNEAVAKEKENVTVAPTNIPTPEITRLNNELVAAQKKIRDLQIDLQDSIKAGEVTASENTDLRLQLSGAERELAFYFGKLRDIEILVQGQNGNELLDRIMKILYATEDEMADISSHIADDTTMGEDRMIDASAIPHEANEEILPSEISHVHD